MQGSDFKIHTTEKSDIQLQESDFVWQRPGSVFKGSYFTLQRAELCYRRLNLSYMGLILYRKNTIWA